MGSLGGVAEAWLPKAIRHSADIQELLDFLNHAPMPDPADVVGLWHLTSVVEQGAEFLVLAGDQVEFVANTEGRRMPSWRDARWQQASSCTPTRTAGSISPSSAAPC